MSTHTEGESMGEFLAALKAALYIMTTDDVGIGEKTRVDLASGILAQYSAQDSDDE